jgi:hypothetical protein
MWPMTFHNLRRPCTLQKRESAGGNIVFVTLITGVLWLCPEPARALQSHGAPEGLITHQLAHVLFAVSMGVLAYWLSSNRFTRQRGWRLIQISCLLFLLWNLVAFSGHVVEGMLPPDLILGPKGSWNQRLITEHGLTAPAYYSLKLDHLVCVPAILCLFLGIRSLYLQTLKEARRQE